MRAQDRCPTSPDFGRSGDFDFPYFERDSLRPLERLRRLAHHQLRAVRTPLRIDRNVTQALGTLLRGRRGGGLILVHARHQPVNRNDHEEIDSGGNQDKRNDSIDELTDWKRCATDRELQIRVIRLSYQQRNQRGKNLHRDADVARDIPDDKARDGHRAK